MTPRDPALARLRATRQRHAQTATEGQIEAIKALYDGSPYLTMDATNGDKTMNETRDDETRNAEKRNAGIDTCPTCGSRVRVVGKTTMHYEPVDDAPVLTPPAQAAAKSAGGTCQCHWCRVARAAAEDEKN